MPLFRFPAQKAVDTRKTNELSHWPDRGGPNRVEPIAAPAFDVPFKFEPEEPIFTVGSCFARNVEAELSRRGFQVPARAIFSLPDFRQLEPGIMNNYGTPSIFNEIAWAFGEREFVADDHIIELMPGKHVDQHISPSLRPDSREKVLARRAAITEVYRSARNCRIIIMTLGLSEVWFDTKSGYYLNVTPRPGMINRYPDRYELHVLSYDEAHAFLRDALILLQKHGHPDLKVLLTVSPVPLTATHRPVDVLVANTYSKAVLRAAAEAVVSELPFVTYYPSYESVVLTDRKVAWMDDMTHVTDTIVHMNVGRMVEAFVGGSALDDAKAILEGGEPAAIERARNARSAGGDGGAAFFSQHGEWSIRSAAFAAEHARFLLDRQKAEAALEALEPHAKSDDTAIFALRCEALLASGRDQEALAILDRLDGKRIKSIALWDALFKSAVASGEPDVVVSVLSRVMHNTPARSATALMLTGRFFRERGDIETAMHYYKSSVDRDRRTITVLEFADLLVKSRRIDEARKLVTGLEPANAGESKRFQRLTDLLGMTV